MTPQVLLDALRRGFLTLDIFHLLIFDEAHQAQKKHPYSKIMQEYYHNPMLTSIKPRIFGTTASPVTSKGVFSTEDSAKQMQQLESTLDAKVFTLGENKELDHYYPRPNEITQWFEPLKCSFESAIEQLDLLVHKYEGKCNSSMVGFDGYRDVKELNMKLLKKVKRLHGSILYTLKELGLLCAYESTYCLLKVMHENVQYGEQEDEKMKISKEAFVNEAMDVLDASLQDKNFPIDCIEDCVTAVNQGLISPKVLLLVNCLLGYRSNENLRCIVFVERVVTAMVLAKILSNIGCLSFLRCNFLSGTGASKKQQQTVLSQFHSGMVNLLMATDVAEEGLDVQSCSSVIRFDLPKTVKSNIQSRGRARMPNSDYIIFLETGNEKHLDEFLELKQSEESMKEQALNRTHYCVLEKKDEEENVDVFQVATTGAIVTIDSSINIISHYCSNLPADKFYKPQPVFVYEKLADSYVCKLILPSNAPFRELTGPTRMNRTLAKQLTCLEACKILHSMGQLSDHLLPVSDVDVPEEEKVMNLAGKDDSDIGTNKRKELHNTVRAEVLYGDWISSQEDVALHAYLICFEFCQKEDDAYANLVLLLKSKLDHDIANTQFPIYLSKGRKAITRFFYAGEYCLGTDQLEHAKAYQQLVFSGMFAKHIKHKENSSVTGAVHWFLNDRNENWEPSQMYLVLPLVSGELTDIIGEIPIDWKAVEAAAHSAGVFLELSSSQQANDTDAYSSESKATHVNAGLQMASGSSLPSELIGMAVITVHTGRIYTVVEVLDAIDSKSPMEEVADLTYANYYQYFAKKYKRVLRYPEQSLLCVKQSHRIHNLLIADVGGSRKKASNDKEREGKRSNIVKLPPELCVYTGLPAALIRSLYLFPSVFHRFNSLILAAQLRSIIATDMPQCQNTEGTVIMQALTTLRCLEGFSYEGLELLGDSFLKYAVSRYLYLVYDRKHEGQLSNRRARFICNKTLHQLAVARFLPGYIRDEPFQADCWRAPGMPSVKSVECKCILNMTSVGSDGSTKAHKKGGVFRIGKTCSNGHRWMCSKTISDALEALIGAFVLCGDSGPALGFMKWIGMEIDFDLTLYEAARNRKVHPRVLNAVNVAGIESQLGYVFWSKALLIEALTHASKEDPHDSDGLVGGMCYQRLEFLGDAALDYLITRHLFSTYPGLSPGVLSDLRSAAVNNDCFARSAVKHNLQRYLRHGSGELLSQITSFVKAVEAAGSEVEEPLFGWEGVPGPKVLGDLIESIAGAILVDSGFDLDRVWDVMSQILSPLVTPCTLPLHPVRELHELSQSKGLCFVWKKTQIMVDKEVVVTGRVGIENEVICETANGRTKKIARKNAAQKILSILKGRGILHPQQAAVADPSDFASINTKQSSEKRTCDADSGGSAEKRQKFSFCEENPKSISLNFGEPLLTKSSALESSSAPNQVSMELSSINNREAHLSMLKASPPVNQGSKHLSSHYSSVKVGLKCSSDGVKECLQPDSMSVKNSPETADELETSINLKMSSTPESRSEEDTTSACCDNSLYLRKPLIEAQIRTHNSECIVEAPTTNLLKVDRSDQLVGKLEVPSIWLMRKGSGRATLNEFCLKRKWQAPKYTLIEQEKSPKEKFVFAAEVETPHGVIKVKGDPLPRKDQARDSAAIKVLLAMEQFLVST
ncbi:hypothetical protein KP509_22G046500 [Ceratopteris richardii]|nr:hypothetical protein KP509_22G046500 [Ceratopteris richardii]